MTEELHELLKSEVEYITDDDGIMFIRLPATALQEISRRLKDYDRMEAELKYLEEIIEGHGVI